ncbi:MAG: hypothetical protein AAGM38_19300, partial [Pseudomonadota bacterium]
MPRALITGSAGFIGFHLARLLLEDTGGIAPNVSFTNPERIEIGARAAIGANCHLWAGNGTARIVIGDDLLMAPDVLLVASTYRVDA